MTFRGQRVSVKYNQVFSTATKHFWHGILLNPNNGMWPLGAKIKLGACGVEAKNCPADSGPRRPREWGMRGEGARVVGKLF